MKNNKLPDGWRVEKLENLVSFTRGSEPGSNSYTEDNSYTRFLRVSDISGTSKEKVYTVDDNLKLVYKGDLLITLDGMPGIVADNFEGAISSEITKIDIIPDNLLLQDYLKFYLKSDDVQRTIYKYATGATILNASKSIQYIDVVLPSLETQKKIVEVLEKTEKAIEKRKETIRLLDKLVKSRFIEMFGEPITNSKGWQVKLLGEVCDIREEKNIKVCDISEINTYWLHFLLSELNLNRLSTGADQSGITVGKLNQVEIPIVPLAMQNEFEKLAKQVDKLKFEMEESLKGLENSFNSLMQRAFKGEVFN